jgi:AcrR family transcriptional regulator
MTRSGADDALDRKPVDVRVRQSRGSVLATTYELLSEEGLGGVTVDAVARRSGVAKTTIYRHWPSREALLLDACAQLGPHFAIADAGSFQADLRALAHRVVEQLLSGPYAAILLSLMAAAERHPDLAALLTAAQTKLVDSVSTIIARARRRGEVRRAADASELASVLVGPLLYRCLFSRQPLSEAFLKVIVDHAARTAGATGDSAPPPARKR